MPKAFKGKEQFPIHKICHRKIHSAFTEKELMQAFHTWEALRTDAEIQTFIAWVARKDPGYFSRTTSTNRKKGK